MSDSNLQKYIKVFAETFDISEAEVKDELEYNSIPAWDSIGHLGMIDEIEQVFGITMEADDIVDFSSFGKGKELLAKYDIKFD